MTTLFPGAGIDNLPDPTPTDDTDSPSHSGLHVSVNDAIQAIETKVGINGSSDTNSIDYKINHVGPGLPVGLTGATAPTRFVGGTVSGHPTSGTFAVGDYITDLTPSVWVCTVAGTPGTWGQVTGGGGGGGGFSDPMTTEGDLIYFHSSAAARLGVGPAGSVLGSNGTDPAWGTGALSSQSGTTYTFAIGDTNTVVESTNASATTFTIPPNSSVAFPIGSQIVLLQGAAGALTVAPGAGVTLNGATLTATSQWGTLVIQKIATNIWVAIASAAGGITPTSTQTLTNKRITKRVTSTSGPGATPTINTDNSDVANFTALATAITSMTTNLSGTPTAFQPLIIGFTDNGTPRAITWGASFEASTISLPTTTVTSTLLLVGFLWNATTSKWRCIGVS